MKYQLNKRTKDRDWIVIILLYTMIVLMILTAYFGVRYYAGTQ